MSYVYDIVRGSILCPDEDSILHVVKYLLSPPKGEEKEGKGKGTTTVLRLKNRFQNPTPGKHEQVAGSDNEYKK